MHTFTSAFISSLSAAPALALGLFVASAAGYAGPAEATPLKDAGGLSCYGTLEGCLKCVDSKNINK